LQGNVATRLGVAAYATNLYYKLSTLIGLTAKYINIW